MISYVHDLWDITFDAYCIGGNPINGFFLSSLYIYNNEDIEKLNLIVSLYFSFIHPLGWNAGKEFKNICHSNELSPLKPQTLVKWKYWSYYMVATFCALFISYFINNKFLILYVMMNEFAGQFLCHGIFFGFSIPIWVRQKIQSIISPSSLTKNSIFSLPLSLLMIKFISIFIEFSTFYSFPHLFARNRYSPKRPVTVMLLTLMLDEFYHYVVVMTEKKSISDNTILIKTSTYNDTDKNNDSCDRGKVLLVTNMGVLVLSIIMMCLDYRLSLYGIYIIFCHVFFSVRTIVYENKNNTFSTSSNKSKTNQHLILSKFQDVSISSSSSSSIVIAAINLFCINAFPGNYNLPENRNFLKTYTYMTQLLCFIFIPKIHQYFLEIKDKQEELKDERKREHNDHEFLGLFFGSFVIFITLLFVACPGYIEY